MGACMSLCEKLSLFPKKTQEAHKQGGVYLDESFNKKDKQHRLRVGLLSKDEESDRKQSISIELQSRRVMEEKEREIEEYNQEQEAIQQMLPNTINPRQQQLTRYSKKREAQQLQNELIVQRDSGRVKREKEKQNEIVPQQKEQDKYAVQNKSQIVQGQNQEDQRYQQINADKEETAKGYNTGIDKQEQQSSIFKPTQSLLQQATLGQGVQEKNQQSVEEIKEKPVFNSQVSGNILMQLDRISEQRQQEQNVATDPIVLDENEKGLRDETNLISTKEHKDSAILAIGSQNIKLTDEDSSKIVTQNDHFLSLSEKVKDIMSGSEQDDLRTCAHTGQRNTAKGSYDEETNQETEGHHLSSQNIEENEEDEDNEEKIKAKEEKIKEIRLSLQQQLNVIKPINSQLPPSNFSYHSKSHQHHQPMSQPSYAQSSYQSHKDQYPFQQQQQYQQQQQQQQQQPHALGHAHSVSQNLNNLIDETDFSLLLNNDSQKNSIIYGNFHPNAFRDSKFILDESIIHPVRDIINNGEDSDTSSKKEEWISDQIRKQQSTQDLVSLLQPARTSLESMNKFDKQSKDNNYINFNENFYFSRQKAESEKAKADSVESISYSDKRASPMNINTISQTPKSRIEEQVVRQQEERFSPQKMVVLTQAKGGSQDDLLPVKEEEDSRVVPTKTDEFSFCFDDAAKNNEEQDIDQFLRKNSKIFNAMHHGWSNQEEPAACGMQQSDISKNQQRISALSQPQKNSNFEKNQKKRCQSENENESGINEKELDRLLPLPDFGGDHKVWNHEKKVGSIEENRNVNDKKIEVVEISTPEAANQSNTNSNQTNSLTYSPILPVELSFPQNNPGNISKESFISQNQSDLQQLQNVQKNEFSNQKSTQNNDNSPKSDLLSPLADNKVNKNEKQESEVTDNKNSQVNASSEESKKQNIDNPMNQENNHENQSNTEQVNPGNNDQNTIVGKVPNDINTDTNANPEDMEQNKNIVCPPNSDNPVPTKEESIDTKPNEGHLLPLNPNHGESPLALEASSDHPNNISIVIQDPKNNTTEQLIYTIHPFNSKISLQRTSVKEAQSPEGSEKSQQPKAQLNDPTKALQFHKSLLENTNRIVMQTRRTPSINNQIPINSSKQVLSQSILDEPSNDKAEKVLEAGRNIDGQMNSTQGLKSNFCETKTPHDDEEEEKNQSGNEQQTGKGNKLKDAKKEESTLEQNSKLLEEEWKSARGNFSQIDENSLFYSALGDLHSKNYKSQDTSPVNQQLNNGSRTSLGQGGNTENFANGVFEESKTFDDLNVSDGKNMCKSDSFKSCRNEQDNSHTNSCQNISPTRMGRSASVNYFKAGVVQMKNSTESPFESCFHTPSGSIRGSLKILQNDLYQRRSISNMQQVSYFKKSSVASQQYYDCDSYQLQVIDSDKLVNRDLVEHPETYMEWIQTLPVIFEIPAVLSSEALYQFELIKQETYQDFVVKLQSENTDNFDLFDVIFDGQNRTIFFRSELGLDQQRVFIVIGEYYVKTQSYAAFYNFKNSFDAQHRLNAFDTLSPLNDDLQNTILVGVSTHRLLPKPCEFLFLKHFSFLQQTNNGVEDEDNNNSQISPIEQMCEIDISLNSEEIEQHLKANKKSIPQNSQIRGELFSGNIATTIQNENQIKVEILFEHNFHSALTVQQARHMYTEMFTQFFEKLDATFP